MVFVDLGSPGVGERVDGALGQPPGPLGLGGLDQAPLRQRLDHPVEHSVVEADTSVLDPLAEGGRHLVGVYGPLGQRDQHCQRQRVARTLRLTPANILPTDFEFWDPRAPQTGPENRVNSA